MTDEELEKLEEEEHEHAVEQFALLLLLFNQLQVELEKELNRFYSQYGTDGVVNYYQSRKRVSDDDKRNRQVVLFLTISNLFEHFFVSFEQNYNFHLKYIVDREIDFFGVKVDIEDVLSTKWGSDNLSWLDRLLLYKDKWTDTIYADLKRSFLKRDDIKTVNALLNERLKSMERVLWRHYVSESTATSSIVRRQVFKKLGVKKYRFYTRADERTCEHCGALHGLIFPMSAFEVGVTASPIHPYCRCWEVPVFDD